MRPSVLLPLALAALAVASAALPVILTPPKPIQADHPRTAFVHLFEWPHTAVAEECEKHLGPAGYSAVQVSPVNEHRIVTSPDYRPWYERYQPVSYLLESRSGSREEFVDMVERCAAVGVDIYVDMVFNHMTGGGSGVGSAGSSWNADTLNFPDYGPEHFNGCDGCDGDCSIGDYNNRYQVQYCRLVGLRDLRTDDEYVRQTLLAFMNDLVGIGVAGFRFDASKHVPTDHIKWFIDNLDELADGREPFVFQEVIDLGGEAITSDEYLQNGKVTEFKFGNEVCRSFRKVGPPLAHLNTIGPDWGWLSTFDSVVFTRNHDTERGHGPGGADIITAKDGVLDIMAQTFMLAHPFGYPKVMSSYDFTDTEAGPPMDGNDNTLWPGDCEHGWNCEHRIEAISNMVMFRNVVSANHTITIWSPRGDNRVGFSVGGLGFYAVDVDFNSSDEEYDTGLPQGDYCDIASGSIVDGKCSGRIISVDSNGTARVSLSHDYPLAAFHVGSMV